MLHLRTSRALLLLVCVLYACTAFHAFAQERTVLPPAINPVAASSGPIAARSEIDEVRLKLSQQQAELDRMSMMITEQSRIIDELRRRLEEMELHSAAPGINQAGDLVARDTTAAAAPGTGPQASPAKTQASGQDPRLVRVEEQARKTSEALTRQLGSITFSGDVRLRYESFYGQLNALANADNPAIVGNELSARHRGRVRVRLSMRGNIGEQFDWGIRLTTGSFADAISTNQTLTDFFTHKPFGLDQAFLTYKPQRVPGLRLQAGKFEAPWTSTEMTFDNDLQYEGINETYALNFKKSTVKNITFAAWQLPFLERASAFVRNANGTVNVDQSRRGGRDLALYGAQLRVRLEPTSKTVLLLAAADHFYSGTQFITPAQFFGGQLQIPVTFTIPATATSPAQTVTAQASISRDLLVTGNANLGISTASNNATNRDGRLASGFNLVDLIGRLELNHSKRFPIMLLLDFVTNTQAHDVSVAGPGGSNLFLRNDENIGYWAELQVGKTKERGDFSVGYTFMRIEKDAVLTPFNFSDLAQQSDVRAHRFAVNYAADPHVILSLTGIVTERPNGLLGVFGSTPPGSLNRPTTRLQLDTTFRF